MRCLEIGVRDSQVTKEIDVDAIQPNRFQPRQDFDEESLRGLAISIQNHGIIQPLVVTFRNGTVYLVSGERRLRPPAKRAGARCPASNRRIFPTRKWRTWPLRRTSIAKI